MLNTIKLWITLLKKSVRKREQIVNSTVFFFLSKTYEMERISNGNAAIINAALPIRNVDAV